MINAEECLTSIDINDSGSLFPELLPMMEENAIPEIANYDQDVRDNDYDMTENIDELPHTEPHTSENIIHNDQSHQPQYMQQASDNVVTESQHDGKQVQPEKEHLEDSEELIEIVQNIADSNEQQDAIPLKSIDLNQED